jgi:hypothetical protein
MAPTIAAVAWHVHLFFFRVPRAKPVPTIAFSPYANRRRRAMKKFAVSLFAIVLTASVARADDVMRFDCTVNYPDGTFGVALVKVIVTGEVDQSRYNAYVEYFSEGYADNLGRYEEWSTGRHYPTNQREAEAFAVRHFNDKR